MLMSQKSPNSNVGHLSNPSTTVGQPTFSLERDVPSALRPKQPIDTNNDEEAETGLPVLRFEGTIERCRDYLHAHGVRLVGVEIAEAGAADVETEPFEGPTALLLGNEVGSCGGGWMGGGVWGVGVGTTVS